MSSNPDKIVRVLFCVLMIATIAAVTFPFLIYWLSVSVIDETPSLFPLFLSPGFCFLPELGVPRQCLISSPHFPIYREGQLCGLLTMSVLNLGQD